MRRWVGSRALVKGLADALLPLGVPLIIVGGILSGFFTPTESAVVATLYAMLITMGIYRTVGWSDLPSLFGEAGILTALIYFTVAAATVFAWLLAFYRVPDAIAAVFLSLTKQPDLILLPILVLFTFLGTFMDATSAILIFVPIVQPVAVAAGIHPVHLGVVVVMTMAFGLLKLPYGLCSLTACGVAKVPVRKIMLMLQLLMLAEFVIIMLSFLFPEVTLVLPRLIAPQ